MPNDLSVAEKVAVTHTPGPWTCEQGSVDGHDVGWWNVDGAPEPATSDPSFSFPRGVCMVYTHDGAGEANARLIAASPDLLTALKRLHETGLVRELDTPENRAALAAIAKAEGGAQ